MALNQVGVVLCDLQMPGMDGVEFLSRVRRMHPEAVRMVFSGHQDFASATAAINRGAVHKFLLKPLDAKAMRESLIEAFEHYEHRETP